MLKNDPAMYLKLTQDEKDVLCGREGRTLQKVMQTLVLYGEACRAERLVPIAGAPHFALPVALPGIGPRLEMLKELIAAGMTTRQKFTVDPRPFDLEAVTCSKEQKANFGRMYGNQDFYEEQLRKLGLRDGSAFTCTPYLIEVDNIPQKGMVLAWSESSAVVYANSVIGARTNRNAALIDLLCNIIGKTPLFGLLTDEGRRADWLFDVKTTGLPHPQVLGGAIGAQAGEGVPFIVGLDRFLGRGLSPAATDYLKEMGAACAAIGAVGLFHVEYITPEARERKRTLLAEDFRTHILDDESLRELEASYPILWEDPDAAPRLCLIGCPHLSLNQLEWWVENIKKALHEERQTRLKVETVLCAAPEVASRFRAQKQDHGDLRRIGVKISSMCGELFMNNPLVAKEPVITNSNKLRAYTSARFFKDKEILKIIIGRAADEGQPR